MCYHFTAAIEWLCVYGVALVETGDENAARLSQESLYDDVLALYTDYQEHKNVFLICIYLCVRSLVHLLFSFPAFVVYV